VVAVVTKATATLAVVVVATAGAVDLEAVKDHAAVVVVVAVVAEVVVGPVATGVRQDVN
jgi:hypothetical protein